jgi:alpha-D-ribose 1-methylphosphonate 5-triphosphate synthase subunit PhnG
MNRKKRTEILIKGSRNIAKRLSEEIEAKYEVRIIEEPNCGLVMIKMREGAQNSLFYLGEILVTEAKVQINNKLGIGILSGNDEELSYYLAVVDAAYNAGLKEVEDWEEILIKEEITIEEELQKEQNKILMTKVNFDTM